MQALSEEEQAKLKRYQKCSTMVERLRLLEASALASNKLLSAVESSFAGQAIRSADYLFLQVVSERRKRNFQKLSDVKETLAIFTRLRDRALDATHIEQS